MFTPKKSALASAVLALGVGTASADIIFDLRVVPGGTPGVEALDHKTVLADGSAPGQVQVEIWAQLTNAAPTSPVFGMQVILGSIKSTPGPLGTGLGAGGGVGMSQMFFQAPFNNQAFVGGVAELTNPPDGILDLGNNATTPQTTMIRPRKDPLNGGTQVGAVFFASNQDPAGAEVQPIPNGFEILMGRAMFNLQSFSGTEGSFTLNWAIPAFTSALNRAQLAQWTDGDGAVNNGNLQFAQMSVGAPINFQIIPEPSVAVTLIGGVATLLGLRRRKH